MTDTWPTWLWRSGFLLVIFNLSACSWFPAVDLAPKYEPPQYVVPDSWHGSSPFVKVKPSDDQLRPDWWKLYSDPILDRLIEEAIAANPDLQAAAERFVQARDEMMKARCSHPRRHSITWRPCILGARFLVAPPECHTGGDLSRRGTCRRLGARASESAGGNCLELLHGPRPRRPAGDLYPVD